MNKHRRNWMIQAPLGLILFGAGLCFSIDAGFVKMHGGNWIAYGTFALVIANSGICVFGNSILEKMRSESAGDNK